MEWLHDVSYFLGGLFLSNAIPHFVSGSMGRAFPSPFAKPPGRGLSSAKVNVLWGMFNFIVGYLLIFRVGAFDLHSTRDVLMVGIGALLMAMTSAHHFGKFHGGNSPGKGKSDGL